MDPYKSEETEINIKDLLFAVLRKLGILLIAGVIVGGAFAFYTIIKKVKTNDLLDITTKLSASESDVQYELRVQNVNKARVYYDLISNLDGQIASQRTYLTDSVYMKIDPENVYQSIAQITLTLEDTNTNGLDDSLFGAYDREVRSGDYLNDYASSIGVKPYYVQELISFSSAKSSNTVITVDNDINSVGSMYVTVIAPSRETCDSIMDLVLADVESFHGELDNSVAHHSISVVAVQKVARFDANVRENQLNQSSKVEALTRQSSTYYDSLDKAASDLGIDDREAVIEFFRTHEIAKVNGIPEETSEKYLSRSVMIKPAIKKGIIGFAAGVLLLALYFVLKYIFGKKFTNQAQFFGVFAQIRKIGVMKPSAKRTKFCRFIDIMSEDDTEMNAANTNKLIGINYANLTGNSGNVLITGTADSREMGEAVKALGLKGDFKPDIFNNPDVLKTVQDYEYVVLIEQRGVSLFKNVKREIDLISNCDVAIAGAILI